MIWIIAWYVDEHTQKYIIVFLEHRTERNQINMG